MFEGVTNQTIAKRAKRINFKTDFKLYYEF